MVRDHGAEPVGSDSTGSKTTTGATPVAPNGRSPQPRSSPGQPIWWRESLNKVGAATAAVFLLTAIGVAATGLTVEEWLNGDAGDVHAWGAAVVAAAGLGLGLGAWFFRAWLTRQRGTFVVVSEIRPARWSRDAVDCALQRAKERRFKDRFFIRLPAGVAAGSGEVDIEPTLRACEVALDIVYSTDSGATCDTAPLELTINSTYGVAFFIGQRWGRDIPLQPVVLYHVPNAIDGHGPAGPILAGKYLKPVAPDDDARVVAFAIGSQPSLTPLEQFGTVRLLPGDRWRGSNNALLPTEDFAEAVEEAASAIAGYCERLEPGERLELVLAGGPLATALLLGARLGDYEDKLTVYDLDRPSGRYDEVVPGTPLRLRHHTIWEPTDA